ncbi:lysophospholipid acyltransferase family protein [Verrucomicrobium sp. BvORR106]|uniref:lysophospholipid acyltransferase family protein n=1 Tax=Verrucomicrobium sp. BvORR106 TaxID=1403819 RepID=UPI00056EFB93|nr:lysophospholipid acyltransferase family protein [Verrucomicrobium sp. BvORR106]
MVIDLSSRLQGPLKRNLYKLAAPVVERGLGIRSFNHLYERTRDRYVKHPDYPSARAWFSSGLQEIGTKYEVDLPQNFTFPSEGPLVIVSNHPFGILDPVILGDLISQYRPYVRFMTNFLLGEMEEMRPWIIPVDPFNGENSAQRNLGPMKEALRFLKQGGALAIFPSGEVAHFKMGRGVEESPWSSHVGALVRRTKATVLPVYFEGQNSVLFHGAGLVHPMLRTGLLFRELFHNDQGVVSVKVGQPIPFNRLRKFEDDESLTRYLRLHTFILSQRPKAPLKGLGGGSGSTAAPAASAPGIAAAPVVPLAPDSPQLQQAFEAEIAALRQTGGPIAQQGNFSVFIASAPEIPNLLREIGRLREVSFRLVGEGTGEEVDLDKFDDYYLHVFLWDDKERRVAGAYRLGRADMIMRRYGAKGLYTSTLFKFQKPFLKHLEQALEMGRSFVAPNYQRSVTALPLLWKGVLTWVCQNPHYTKLYGPVSISQAYQGLSRKLMVEFLRENNFHPDLATLVKPRKPFRYGKNRKILREFISADLGNVDDFSALISSLEEDGKGIPVLLKHYLRLNGTLLSFNVDKDFGSCLDGLILVDVTETDPKLLAKYMGEEACAKYLKHHGVEVAKETEVKG